MELTKVKSSNIDAIGYGPEHSLLTVRFRDGSVYQYLNTSAQAHAALMAAESKGKHLAQHFRNGVRSLADGGEINLKEPYLVGETPSESPVTRKNECDVCGGSGKYCTNDSQGGFDDHPEYADCSACDGTGQARQSPDTNMLSVFPPDECCKGPVDMNAVDRWACPKCGCEYHVEMIDGVRRWVPEVAVMLW